MLEREGGLMTAMVRRPKEDDGEDSNVADRHEDRS